ncbi:serine hydrolase domain-containing protein [Mycolicibacterium agri]|uniref:serine hydrolase domain-containing protein n=1 Tax=Mycolicibacterium agri TaxID=36811 RepID=UPI001F24F4B0|nr:serine hydrolase domain-containing protein [Mycolicibacterium agri]
MHRPILFALIAFLVAVAAPAHADVRAVDAALSRAVETGDLPGGVVVVRNGADVIRYSAGHSDVDAGIPFEPDTHVRAASITKTFVAATVMQLVAEGRVNLDAPIETYLPGRIHGDGIDGNAITVRQLLRHQSGLPEYFDDVTAIPTQPVTADQLLDSALARPAQFAPGTQMKYTNTNYIVVGLLIEAVTGRPATDEVTRRVIAPLGLRETYFPAPGDTGLRAPFAHGYEREDGVRTDVTDFNASATGMSGMLVSTNEDLSAFIGALVDGRVVPPAQLREMMQTVSMPNRDGAMSYGLGLAAMSLPCGVTAWAHGGDLLGYHSVMAKAPGREAISVTLTQDPDVASVSEDPRADILTALYC